MKKFRRNSRTSSGMSQGAEGLSDAIKLAIMQADDGDMRTAVGGLLSAAHDFGFMHAKGDITPQEVQTISALINEFLYGRIYPKLVQTRDNAPRKKKRFTYAEQWGTTRMTDAQLLEVINTAFDPKLDWNAQQHRRAHAEACQEELDRRHARKNPKGDGLDEQRREYGKLRDEAVKLSLQHKWATTRDPELLRQSFDEMVENVRHANGIAADPDGYVMAAHWALNMIKVATVR